MANVHEINHSLLQGAHDISSSDEVQEYANRVKEEGERLKKDIEAKEQKARFKIEIMFGKERATNDNRTSVGVMTIWESGKRLHGGGDQKMYWCGYKDCGKPMSTDHWNINHTVCPSCQRENFLDPDTRREHFVDLEERGMDSRSLKKLAMVSGEKYFRHTPANTARLIESVWRDLECNADVYIKYHPTDIRFNPLREEGTSTLEAARSNRQVPVIYTLRNIIKDTEAGAEVWKRFKALITA